MDAVRTRIALAMEGRYLNSFLFVCSANIGRSATAEHIARRDGYLADSAGSKALAVRPLTLEAIERAERIVCMEAEHEEAVLRLAPHRKDDVEIWYIPDMYLYGDRDLVTLIEAHMRHHHTRGRALP